MRGVTLDESLAEARRKLVEPLKSERREGRERESQVGRDEIALCFFAKCSNSLVGECLVLSRSARETRMNRFGTNLYILPNFLE